MLFCKHDYELIDQLTFKSEVERVRELGLQPTSFNSLEVKVVSYFKCSKCKKLKKFVDKH